jgi:hypothetical protein
MARRFFEHCHGMAVLLSKSLHRNVADMRVSEPMLLLAICAVGARFWTQGDQKYVCSRSLLSTVELTVVRQYRNVLDDIPSQVHRDYCTTRCINL